jgi:hypothetical protein
MLNVSYNDLFLGSEGHLPVSTLAPGLAGGIWDLKAHEYTYVVAARIPTGDCP